MDETMMANHIISTFAGVETTAAYGYTFFFYSSERKLPFATMAAADNEYDRISNLDRPGVFRLNIGIHKQTFQALFGAGDVDTSAYDGSPGFPGVSPTCSGEVVQRGRVGHSPRDPG